MMFLGRQKRCRQVFRIAVTATAITSLFVSAQLGAQDNRPRKMESDLKVSPYVESYSEASIFVTALKNSNLWSKVEESEELTLFVPTNSALYSEGAAFLLEIVLNKIENRNRLNDLMAIHIYKGSLQIGENSSREFIIPMSNGGCLDVSVINGSIKIGPEATVTKAVNAADGTIYFIDHLLWMPYKDQMDCT